MLSLKELEDRLDYLINEEIRISKKFSWPTDDSKLSKEIKKVRDQIEEIIIGESNSYICQLKG